MQRPHQHCASFDELLLKGLISKAKDKSNRKQKYISMGQERIYDCDVLNNQFTKMVELNFISLRFDQFIIPLSYLPHMLLDLDKLK